VTFHFQSVTECVKYDFEGRYLIASVNQNFVSNSRVFVPFPVGYCSYSFDSSLGDGFLSADFGRFGTASDLSQCALSLTAGTAKNRFYHVSATLTSYPSDSNELALISVVGYDVNLGYGIINRKVPISSFQARWDFWIRCSTTGWYGNVAWTRFCIFYLFCLGFLCCSVSADGIAFVIHDDPDGWASFNVSGGGLGYAGTRKSLAVEMDVYLNGDKGETLNYAHVAVHSVAGGTNTPWGTPLGVYRLQSLPVKDTGLNTVIVNYDGTTLTFYVNGYFGASIVIDLRARVADAGGFANIGFLGSAGGLRSDQYIRNFRWESTCIPNAEPLASPVEAPVEAPIGPPPLYYPDPVPLDTGYLTPFGGSPVSPCNFAETEQDRIKCFDPSQGLPKVNFSWRLSTETIIGIVFGVLFAVALIIVVAVVIIRKRNRAQAAPPPASSGPASVAGIQTAAPAVISSVSVAHAQPVQTAAPGGPQKVTVASPAVAVPATARQEGLSIIRRPPDAVKPPPVDKESNQDEMTETPKRKKKKSRSMPKKQKEDSEYPKSKKQSGNETSRSSDDSAESSDW
jgi:hypothetical protein